MNIITTEQNETIRFNNRRTVHLTTHSSYGWSSTIEEKKMYSDETSVARDSSKTDVSVT